MPCATVAGMTASLMHPAEVHAFASSEPTRHRTPSRATASEEWPSGGFCSPISPIRISVRRSACSRSMPIETAETCAVKESRKTRTFFSERFLLQCRCSCRRVQNPPPSPKNGSIVTEIEFYFAGSSSKPTQFVSLSGFLRTINLRSAVRCSSFQQGVEFLCMSWKTFLSFGENCDST